MSHLLIVSEEFLARIHVGLGEIQTKFAVPVIQEIDRIVNVAKTDSKAFLVEVEKHLEPHRAAVAAKEAQPDVKE